VIPAVYDTLVAGIPDEKYNPAGKAQYPRALELALARDTHEL
jgi:hypothetical protein